MSEPTNEEVEKALRGLGRDTNTDYPRDLYTATRAEFVTEVRTHQSKRRGPGCPFVILSVITAIAGLFGAIGPKPNPTGGGNSGTTKPPRPPKPPKH